MILPRPVEPFASGPFAGLTEAGLARVLTTVCDVAAIPDGPLMWRLGVLTERLASRRVDVSPKR